MNQFDLKFWQTIQQLVKTSQIKIDRPKGSIHPKYPDYVYPHDYGCLSDTISTDGVEIDCWVGSSKLASKQVTGIIVTIDAFKRDSEIKILINCSADDIQEILECHNRGSMSGVLLKAPKQMI